MNRKSEPPETTRAPRAFRLDTEGRTEAAEIEAAPDFTALPDAPSETPPAPRSSWLWTLFWSVLGLLLTLALFDAGWALAQSLAMRAPWLEQVVWALMALMALILLIWLLREMMALFRLRKVSALRTRAEILADMPESAKVRRFAQDLSAFYARDPAGSTAQAELARILDEIHDGPTLLALTERTLLSERDARARKAIAEAAQRVSVVTALSPRAIVDIAFVLVQGVQLIRRLSQIYGGRASGAGLLRLSGRVLAHLLITGGVAMADQLLSQVVGAGLAARLSAKLGEGVLNGVLTARAGIAAVALCRPMPFRENAPIQLSEVVKISITQ